MAETTERTGTLRIPYVTTFGAHGTIKLIVAYGRSLGLQVDSYHDGGWIERRGWIVARGNEAPLRRLLRYFKALETR